MLKIFLYMKTGARVYEKGLKNNIGLYKKALTLATLCNRPREEREGKKGGKG